MRRFCSSLSELEAAGSKVASMRDAVTLACCPPGPDERLARSSTSESGIATPRATGIGSSTAAPAAGASGGSACGS